MLASRALLAKQVAAVLTRQPACLVHQDGDWGNWGNINIAVVSERGFQGEAGGMAPTSMRLHSLCITRAAMLHTTRFQIFAPNQQRMHVMDHMKSQPAGENRNLMVEAARFSHGQGRMQMQDLSRLDVKNFDAVIFPGGHGVTKNLSTFNKDCKVHNDVERILKEFHRSQKPIGLASMAFLLACCVLPSLEVTMGCGRDENSRWGCWPNTSMVQAMGCPPALQILPEAYVDENKVISTPSFMWETEYHYHYIFDGIGNMVKHVMSMTAKWSG